MKSNNGTTHPSHPEHPLDMINQEGAYTCDGCKMDGTGLRYRCEWCNYDLHHECMFAPTKLAVQGQICHFLAKPPQGAKCTRVNCTKCITRCDACGMTVKGFVYHCSEKGLDFHPRCAKLEGKISVGDLTFWLEKQGTSGCAWCKRKLLHGAKKKIPGWSYVSKYDDYNFHVYCVMEMAMHSSSATSYNGGHAMQEMKQLPLNTKFKKSGAKSSNKWLGILKIFLSTLFSLLLGDPTAILASTMAHLVTQGLFDQG